MHLNLGGGMGTPLMLEEIHSHLVRSPPPLSWHPHSPRGSAGAFSPDSGTDSGMEFDQSRMCNDRDKRNENERILSPTSNDNNRVGRLEVNRTHSEEHILSPCRDLLKSELLSPARGTTPEYLIPPNNEGLQVIMIIIFTFLNLFFFEGGNSNN